RSARLFSVVPTGLGCCSPPDPSDKSLGYYQPPLVTELDPMAETMNKALETLNPKLETSR
ncbi:MAG: hypothetical protein QME81_16820, partial [bacterium]|nr:hypothetical protein [bacterium]